MKDYSKGKIYKIIDESNGDVYIGSTIQSLEERFLRHKIFKEYNKEKCNCKIFLIEDYPCNSKRELEMREQYFIDNTDCINKTSSYREINFHKEQARIRASKYYEKNKEKCNSFNKLNHAKRMNDKNYRDKRNKYMRDLRLYQESWGGRTDKYYNNSLLKIDVNLFL